MDAEILQGARNAIRVCMKVKPSERVFILTDNETAALGQALEIEAKAAGAVTFNYGVFINTVISFLIVAFAIFLLIRGVNRLKRKQEAPPAEPITKECSYCLSVIPIKATRCPHCTSELKGM